MFVDKNTDTAENLRQEFIRIKPKREQDREAIVTGGGSEHVCGREGGEGGVSLCLVFDGMGGVSVCVCVGGGGQKSVLEGKMGEGPGYICSCVCDCV